MTIITITATGKEPVTALLDEKNVEAFRTLVTLLPNAPTTPDESEKEKTLARRGAAIDAAEKADFEECGRKLKELHPYYRMLVFTFLDLLKFGGPGLCAGDNWISGTVEILLETCASYGIGDALTLGPGEMLKAMAESYDGFQQSIESMRTATTEHYARLFHEKQTSSRELSALA